MLKLIAFVPLLPFIGFLINGLGRNILSKNSVSLIGSGTMLLSFMISIGMFFELNASELKSHTFHFFDWIKVGSLDVGFSFLYDPLAAIMLLVITGVGFLIHLYSAGYMHDDDGFAKFFAYLNLFVFFMLLLVLGANYAIMFIGWEGVGLCSYLLIGFWYKNTDYNNAAKKAFVMNRIGDLGFLIGLFLIFQTFGSISFNQVFANAAEFSSGDITLTSIALLLFIGAMGKSAQLPLYTWLPDAMAGPTPVSALIHAATMVTAGIYMIARSSIIYVLAPVAMEVITIVGMLTAVWAALIALTQTDIKKVLAYSTVSQLGYMFVALGVGSFTGAIFHLMTHAFFKALLFLGAGSVIHAMSGEQDMRKMGGLKTKLPITFATVLIGTLAISGVPPFAGFFSKDEILAASFVQSSLVFWVMAFCSVLTAFYMFRMLFLTFYGSFRGTHEQEHHLHESPKNMTVPLIVLAILSTLAGFLGLPEVFSHTHALNEFLKGSFIMTNAKHFLDHASHTFEYSLMIGSVGILAFVYWFARKKYANDPYLLPEDAGMNRWQKLSYHKFYIDEFYNAIVTKPLNKLSDYYRSIDVKVLDGFINVVGQTVQTASKNLRTIQTGYTGFYIFAMVVGIVIIMMLNLILG